MLNVRLNTLLVHELGEHEPGEHLGRPIAGVGRKALRLQPEGFGCSGDHGPSRGDLRLL